MTGSDGGQVSDFLQALIDCGAAGSIALGELADEFGQRSFGLLLLLLALPNAVGAGIVPGLSTVFAVPQLALAFQMLLGREHPWIPERLRRRQLARRDIVRVARGALPVIIRVERLLHPCWPAMLSPPGERLIGLVCLILSAAVALPIPFANQLPAVVIAIISLGLIYRDGRFICFGFVLAAVTMALAVMIVFGGASLLLLAVHAF